MPSPYDFLLPIEVSNNHYIPTFPFIYEMTKVDKYRDTKQAYDKQHPTIRISKSVKEDLYSLPISTMGKTPNDVIKELIDFWKEKHK